MICQNCHKESVLILSTCADCDPELHTAHNEALRSVVDEETVTPQIEKYFQILGDRKINGYGKSIPVGVLK
jgi:hypothetical protein